MSTPIQVSETIFPTAEFNPGSGLFAVRVKDEYDFTGTLLQEAVERAVPVTRHYDRPSPYLCGKGRNLVYSAIGAEIRTLYEAWNARMKKQQRAPIVNRRWIENWLQRMGMDKDDTINRLGMAQPLDTVSLGVTPYGGRKLVISTFEEYYGELFARRQKEAYTRIDNEGTLLEALTDVVSLTALAKLNRWTMYYAIADAAGWRKEQTFDHTLVTLTSGINTELWEVFNNEVRVGDGEAFLLPMDTDSWAVCQAPRGEANEAFPWRVIHTEQGQPPVVRNRIHTRVSLTCLPPERQWKAERRKIISIEI